MQEVTRGNITQHALARAFFFFFSAKPLKIGRCIRQQTCSDATPLWRRGKRAWLRRGVRGAGAALNLRRSILSFSCYELTLFIYVIIERWIHKEMFSDTTARWGGVDSNHSLCPSWLPLPSSHQTEEANLNPTWGLRIRVTLSGSRLHTLCSQISTPEMAFKGGGASMC